MPGFLPLDLAKLIYGGFNPQGQSPDRMISLGRSIAHGIRGNTGVQPVLGNTSTGYPPLDSGDGSNLPPAADYTQGEPIVQTNGNAAAQAYAAAARQPGVTPIDPSQAPIPDNLMPRTPNGGMVPGGMPASREFGGSGFGNYASAQNSFIPGLIAWNGPGQANPTGGEPIDERGSRNFMGLARRLGGTGITNDHTPVGSPAPQWASAHLPQIRGKG